MASDTYAPHNPVGRDPYVGVHEAAASAGRAYEGGRGISMINHTDWAPGAVESLAEMLELIAKTSEDTVELDPRARDAVQRSPGLLRRLAPVLAEVAQATRRAHAADLDRYERGKGDRRVRAWNVGDDEL